jgi:hypothetical protein
MCIKIQQIFTYYKLCLENDFSTAKRFDQSFERLEAKRHTLRKIIFADTGPACWIEPKYVAQSLYLSKKAIKLTITQRKKKALFIIN